MRNPEHSREEEARSSKKESYYDEKGILMKYDRETHTYRPSVKIIDTTDKKLKKPSAPVVIERH